MREVFARARKASPCIVFFDELDALAPNRGRSGDSGGVMDRIVSQLLTEIDGVRTSTDRQDQVVVIGATNRPDLIDPALMRPGRFDRLVYLGIPTSDEEREAILTALTSKFVLDEDCLVKRVVQAMKGRPGLTGADLYALVADAMSTALSRKIQGLENGRGVADSGGGSTISVSFEDFDSAMRNLKPSVSPQEMTYYESLQNDRVQ